MKTRHVVPWCLVVTTLIVIVTKVKKPSMTLSSGGRASPQRDSDPSSTRLVIVSHTRSGSSFCGEALNQGEECFYWFEPMSGIFQHLYGMKWEKPKCDAFTDRNGFIRSPPRFEHTAVSTHLHNLLHCQLDALPIEVLTDYFITSSGMGGILPKKLKESGYVSCLKQQKPGMDAPAINGYKCNMLLDRSCSFNDGVAEVKCAEDLHGPVNGVYNISVKEELKRAPESYAAADQQQRQRCLQEVQKNTSPCLADLTKKCKDSKIRATKLVRFFLETARYLLQKDPHVKFLYYVRDPRGVLESRFRRAGTDLRESKNKDKLAKQAFSLCETMTADYAVFQELSKVFPNSFMILKYETLATKTEEALSSIYDFIGHDIPPSVLRYFQFATSAKKEGNAMNTFRKNATITSAKWRANLSPEIQELIQNICSSALEKFAYS